MGERKKIRLTAILRLADGKTSKPDDSLCVAIMCLVRSHVSKRARKIMMSGDGKENFNGI